MVPVSRFKLPAVLPRGDLCTLHSLNHSGRPFMGPNLYLTLPASFTQFHQYGNGTVDSGHVCLKGYNEVVLLRRLTEGHKRHALWLLNGNKIAGQDGTTKGTLTVSTSTTRSTDVRTTTATRPCPSGRHDRPLRSVAR